MKTGNTNDLLRGMAIRLAWQRAPDRQEARQQDLLADAALSDARAALLTEVDFKWLMAGQGCWIDIPRFHDDPAYAQAHLEVALRSSTLPLRQCAARLQSQIGRGAVAVPAQIDTTVAQLPLGYGGVSRLVRAACSSVFDNGPGAVGVAG